MAFEQVSTAINAILRTLHCAQASAVHQKPPICRLHNSVYWLNHSNLVTSGFSYWGRLLFSCFSLFLSARNLGCGNNTGNHMKPTAKWFHDLLGFGHLSLRFANNSRLYYTCHLLNRSNSSQSLFWHIQAIN